MIVTYPLVHLRPNENPWVTYVKQQIYRKNNCINLIVVGKPGSSKSWSLISFFLQINPDFSVEDDCFFHAKELINLFRGDKVKKGCPIMYDESGIDTNSQRWQDEVNRGLNAFFQTSRHRNYIFGMTVPFQSFVSKGVRTLMNCKFKCNGWNSKNESLIRPLYLEWNDEMQKFYSKGLNVQTKEGNVWCDEIRLPKPPDKIIKVYEKIKKEFTTELYEEIGQKIEAGEREEKISSLPRLTMRQQLVIKGIKEGMNLKELAICLKCSIGNVSNIIATLRSKGIEIELKSPNESKKGGYSLNMGKYEGVY